MLQVQQMSIMVVVSFYTNMLPVFLLEVFLVTVWFFMRVMRRIFGPRWDRVTGEWRKLHNELNLYSSPNIVWAIKSRRLRWMGQ